jgi:hypothetical protein
MLARSFGSVKNTGETDAGLIVANGRLRRALRPASRTPLGIHIKRPKCPPVEDMCRKAIIKKHILLVHVC